MQLGITADLLGPRHTHVEGQKVIREAALERGSLKTSEESGFILRIRSLSVCGLKTYHCCESSFVHPAVLCVTMLGSQLGLTYLHCQMKTLTCRSTPMSTVLCICWGSMCPSSYVAPGTSVLFGYSIFFFFYLFSKQLSHCIWNFTWIFFSAAWFSSWLLTTAQKEGGS